MQLLVDKNDMGVVITTSPGFQPKHKPAKCRAAVPLETATQNFDLNFFF